MFARLAEDRSTVRSLIEDSHALADAIVGFVREKDLLDLPPTSKLRIEDIPPHLRGFAVAQILTAPPFEPELESVWFWDLALLETADSGVPETAGAASSQRAVARPAGLVLARDSPEARRGKS